MSYNQIANQHLRHSGSRMTKLHCKKLDNLPVEDNFEIYKLFLTNWDNSKIGNVKESKAIFINKDHEAIAICDIPSNDIIGLGKREKLRLDIDPVLKKAVELKASSLVVAQNNFPKNIYLNSGKLRTFRELTNAAKRKGLIFLDLMSLSEIIYSSVKTEIPKTAIPS